MRRMSWIQTRIKSYLKKRRNQAEDKEFQCELLKRYEGHNDANKQLLRQPSSELRQQEEILREIASQIMFELADQRAAIPPKPPSKAKQTFYEFFEGVKFVVDFIDYGFIKPLRKEDRAEIVGNPLVQIGLFLNLCLCVIIFFKTSLEFYYVIYLLLQVVRFCIYIGNRSIYLEKLEAEYNAAESGVVKLDKRDEENEPIEAGGRLWVKQGGRQRIPRSR